MNLSAFSVSNFRSIASAQRLPIGPKITTLIGPNNEGKSNILRSLVAALQAIPSFGRIDMPLRRVPTEEVPTDTITMRNRLVARDGYDWERDFPVYLQDQEENGQTLLTLEFEPSKKKREALSTIIGSPLRGHLHVELRFGKEHAEIRARDTASEAVVPRKSLKLVCRFIGNSINCQYIPSLRTADSARKIVEQIVERELSALEEKPVYRSALSQIAKIQRPVLQELSKSVTATLKQFLPSVKKVRLRVSAEERVMALRRACSIIVDDGAETNLKEKGDGVQSLAALSLMRHAALLSAGGKSILLAIEEPETHLHSKALHQLRNVLQEITTKHQVVLTTHNPIFVNRERIVTNIVVTQNQAKPAQSLEEIRQCLGVRPSDNLRQAEIALVVEGHDDRVALTALLSSYSKVLKAALTSGVLGIDPLNGSGNLPYKLSLLRSTALCAVFVFVDNDAAGKSAVEKAIGDGVLTKAEVKYAMCRGKDESELEDFYHQAVYEAAIDKHFSVKLVKPLMRGRKKWSDRMADCFQASGQIWDDAAKTAAKTFVAAEVAAAPKKALNHAIRKPFDALVAALEERVSALGNPAQ